MALEIPVPDWYFLALVLIHIFTVVAFSWVSEEYMERGRENLSEGIGLMTWLHEFPELVIFSCILWFPAAFPTLGKWFYYYGFAILGFLGLFVFTYHWAEKRWPWMAVVLVAGWQALMLSQITGGTFLWSVLLYAPVYLGATGATFFLWEKGGNDMLASGMGTVAVTEFVEALLCVRLTLSMLFGGTSAMMIVLLAFLALQVLGPSIILLGTLKRKF